VSYYKAFLIKYAEIGTKGKNRPLFEAALVQQIKLALNKVAGTFTVKRAWGRIYVEAGEGCDYEGAVAALQNVFGIAGVCPLVQVADEGFAALREVVVRYIGEAYPERNQTFKVAARRSRKDYPLDSMQINREIGQALLEAYPQMRVDVHRPEIMLHIEIREQINIYAEVLPGLGGMPVGSSGKAMLLLSGGIDSPVAGYMVAKRGVKLDAVYFHAPPYTSDRAKQKVVDLARILTRYTGPIYLHVINFTDIQLYIYDKCPHDELTIIMRRYMMRIAERLARETECLGLITGESIAQVASQTLKSLAATDAATAMPVYRPLIGFDKMEIVQYAECIGTYETSILPYEDCCTIFVAKHPVTKPDLARIEKHELYLAEKIEELVEAALQGKELLVVK
jgi:thiamine biosynthesis protein ThiI